MKKVLLFITMAAALLFTQCKKEVSVPSAGKTVSMTVTAGPGSKTDITDAGAITWSTGDKLYVGDGSKYIGYLTLVGDGGSATGTFTGNVTLGEGVTGEKSFGFFYLGSAERTLTVGDETAEVDFSSQDITKGTDGKLTNASKQHVGYGKANGTVTEYGMVTDINVRMVSKVALAHFSFTKDADTYAGALTLSGDNICNKMTVNFDSEGFSCTGTVGDISLTNTTSSEKYVMLVPTAETTGSQELTFTGVNDNVAGTATLADGILPNKFYGLTGAIAVPLEAPAPAGRFTVDANGTKVDFAPGNLYYNGADDAEMNADLPSGWNFYEHQWDCYPSETSSVTKSMEINLFTWGYGTWSTVYNTMEYQTGIDVTMTDWGSVAIGSDPANTWRTLSRDEWNYLLGYDPEEWNQTPTYGRPNAMNLCAWVELTDVNVYGLVILPDGSDATASGVTTSALVSSSGAVFLPAAGFRVDTGVNSVGSIVYYWSSSPSGSDDAFYMSFDSGSVYTFDGYRNGGYAVRLVR